MSNCGKIEAKSLIGSKSGARDVVNHYHLVRNKGKGGQGNIANNVSHIEIETAMWIGKLNVQSAVRP